MQSFTSTSVDISRIHGTGVAGIFPNRQMAVDTIGRLQESGFSSSQLVLLGNEEKGSEATAGRLGLPHEVEHSQQHSYMAWGILGGAIAGLLLGAESVALVGAAGVVAIEALLGFTAVGMVSGGIFGSAHAGLAASEEATALRDEIRAGHVLVAVHAQGQDEQVRAREALKAAGAGAIHEWALIPSNAENVAQSHLGPDPAR